MVRALDGGQLRAKAAEARQADAAKAAREAKLVLEPVSVFISRTTQRLYVRRGFEALAQLRERGLPLEVIEHLRRAPEILDPGEDPDPYGMMKDISVSSDDTGK
jgi:hypothetical protein